MKRGLWMLLLTAVVLSGCWDRMEMDDLAIVNATAIDRNEAGQWVMTYQVVIPRTFGMRTGGGGSGSPVMTFTTKGNTLGEAVQNARRELPRQLFFPHSRVVIVSRSAAERGIGDIIDFYLRDEESRETSNLLLYDGSTRDILEVLTNLERLPGNSIHQLIEGPGKQNGTIPSKVYEIVTMLVGPSKSAAVPEIRVSGKLDKQTTSEAVQRTRRMAVLKLHRAGVLKGDKFVGWMTEREANGVGFATGRAGYDIVPFACGDGGEERASFAIERSDTDLRTSARNGRVYVDIDIAVQGSVIESACRSPLKRSDTLERMERRIERSIEDDVRTSFEGAKRFKADVFGIGEAVHREHPRWWKELEKDWDANFAEVQLRVDVDARIRNTGMINDSVAKKLEGK
ncbi:Ger(x)C family spore germination protein [Paenibacillus sp.]|uniref:Ger(x)C family spore germination protein n=1 Tax=Paenibacillus sp. TaxID=58172 RepID=UPI002D51A568|nr:Ger(x)C family spore germination protein [Paenibacillus sp.]HZG85803.1 Ger(x)C family spore germination protein [Paenibacillus sp.]